MVFEAESAAVIDAAIKIHSALGPGLLESAYQVCLVHELRKRGLRARSQVRVPILYDGVRLDAGYRIDILVEESVVVEIKAVANVLPIHHAQLLSYLKLSRHRIGLLLNFHVLRMRDGIQRVVA
jgi:GxxExxY protein